jgi:hypothetical protein
MPPPTPNNRQPPHPFHSSLCCSPLPNSSISPIRCRPRFPHTPPPAFPLTAHPISCMEILLTQWE